MTKEEWAQVEASMRSPFGCVHLLVDGYGLTLQVRQAKPLKFVIALFVNGWMRGEWGLKDCEERRRFFRPISASVHTAAQRKELTKGLSKAAIKRYMPDLEKKFTYYTSDWPSFAPLKRHLVANNTSIAIAPTEETAP